MSELQHRHLTEDELSAAILNEPLDASADAHLAMCPECQAEVNGFDQGMQDFRRTSHAWSEQRSLRMSLSRLSRSSAEGGKLALTPAYAWGAAGLVAIGVTVSTVQLLHHEQISATPSEQISDDDSPEQIARDNELLTQVHYELTRPDLPAPGSSAMTGKAGR